MNTYLSTLLNVSIIFLATIFTSCTSYKVTNIPIEHPADQEDTMALSKVVNGRSDDLLVLLAFSGGGTRAAAFSYGVLKEMADIQVNTENGPNSLLNEIDAISSVSGGSFTSAYFGLHGDRIFDDFEERFLRRDVQGALVGRVFNPFYLTRRLLTPYSKTDMVVDYYDKAVFDNATLGDLTQKNGPMIVINATDLSSGGRFPFKKSVFDMICTDFSSFSVSRAVAASSGVPVIFQPVVLKNYAEKCSYKPPAWLEDASLDTLKASRKLWATNLKRYLNQDKQPWFHLVDGGLSDNLGLRTYYDLVNLVGDPNAVFEALFSSVPQQILIIMVNSKTEHKAGWARKYGLPSIGDTVDSISSSMINLYSTDTIDIVRHSYNDWASTLSTPEHPVTFNFANISFERVQDDVEKQHLNDIGTSFDLTDTEVDRLIDAGRKLLRDSPSLQQFLQTNMAEND